MIQKTTIQFLKDLKKNNSKEWFDLNRSEYEKAKKDFLQFLETLIPKIAKFDPEVAEVKAKDCLFRINRDVRFSKDKSPYKPYFGAVINPKGRKSTYPSYYVHFEPDGLFAGGGAYTLLPEELQKIRQEIDYNADAFLKIVSNKSFKSIFKEVKGDALVRPPKGFDENSPVISYIKMKQWFAMTDIADTHLKSDEFEKELLVAFKALVPLNTFLQQAIS